MSTCSFDLAEFNKNLKSETINLALVSQVKYFCFTSPEVDLNSLLYFNGQFVILFSLFSITLFMVFLNLIQEAGQKGSG